MKFTIISGSHGDKSQSSRVASYIGKEIEFLDDSYSSHLIDLANNPLPLWDESVWNDGETVEGKVDSNWLNRSKKAMPLFLLFPNGAEWSLQASKTSCFYVAAKNWGINQPSLSVFLALVMALIPLRNYA